MLTNGTLFTRRLLEAVTTRTTQPLSVPANALLRLAGEHPTGNDVSLNIR